MILLARIVVGLLALLASALLLWCCWRNDRREDQGRVSPGYMKARGWGRR